MLVSTFSPMGVWRGSSVSPRASPAPTIRLCILPSAILRDHFVFIFVFIQIKGIQSYLFIIECTAERQQQKMSIMLTSSWYSQEFP